MSPPTALPPNMGWKNKDLENMRVYFVDAEGRLWGTDTGSTRCPRKLKKVLKRNGTYDEFMRRDFRGINIETLTK